MSPRILLFPLFLLPVLVALTGLFFKQHAAAPAPPAAAARPAPEAVTPEASASDQLMAGPLTAEEARHALARAEAQRAAGQHEAAIATLQPLLDHADPDLAAEAGLRVAALRLALGYPTEAAGALENLLARFPSGVTAERAELLLGVAKRKGGDCAGVVDVLSRAADSGGSLAAHAAFEAALCYRQLGDVGAALARTEQAIGSGAPRLLTIEALEEQAELLEAAGDPLGALVRWERLVGLARAASYKAETRLTAARLSRQVGREAEAVGHYVAVVAEAPTVRGAATALDELAALEAQERVSYFQAGLARYWSRDYSAALRNFDGALASQGESGSWGAAAYYRAATRLRQGAEGAAVADLLALPGWFPASPYAPQALLRAGKILESNGSFGPAAEAYRRLSRDYPASREAKEGLFRLGLSSLLRGAPGEAAAAWAELDASDASVELKSLGLLWQGKLAARDGRHDAAHAAWQAAAGAGPTAYGSLRARGLLEGNAAIQVEAIPLDHGRLEPSAAELAELDAWLAARGLGLDAARAELAADASLRRADLLLSVGLDLEAGWEVDEPVGRLGSDVPRRVALSLWLRQHGQHHAALRQAQTAADAAKVGPREAPAALRKLLYPLPWTELFAEYGERYGVNPLAFAALVRQESHFEVAARSSADARGLTQVMPATGREIANALGRGGWQVEDLYKPAVSLEFGAFYFSQRLQRFGGALFPALAAYNAGDGAVDRWLRDYGSADMDIFAERIPYDETNHYLKVVFENYGMYRELYGQR